MSIELDSKDEQCFYLYWKIENFSYCWEEIKSPVFLCSGIPCWLILQPKAIECRLFVLNPDYEHCWTTYLISFLTCDGSLPLNGSRGGSLRVSEDIIFGTRRSAFLPEDTLTIRFRYPTAFKRGTYFVHSRIGVKRESFLLTLKNFNEDRSNIQKCLEKSERCGVIELNSSIVGGINTDKQFSIEISRSGGEKCYIVFKMSILDVDGAALNEISDEFFLSKDEYQAREFHVIKMEKLLACKDLLLPNDTLSLKCDFSVSLGVLTEQTSVISYDGDVIPLIKESDLSADFKKEGGFESIPDLQTDLKNMFEGGIFADAAIKVGTEIFKVHKNILSARSPVFRKMFTKGMKGTIDGTLVIKNLDEDTTRRLLIYIYTDTISACQWEDIKNLFSAADNYEITSLKKKCVSLMKASLSVSNVCEALVLANSHQDDDLKTAAFGFIFKYGFSSDAWKEFEKLNFSLAHQTLLEISARGQSV
ncbi:Speckle-type POZ protein-like B like protein [Argiope bruennichi]|uniref:Speckle-type POZ protein-like B like protein n=1 Tax=Argiope bruennichi TaxID=94029 RepID=A0A8T0EI93_ARGBR|nr:Speckle-type POZ protein-like B like protein [Argiope bruennichi]